MTKINQMDYIKINQKLWNQRTKVHYSSDFYNVDEFVKGEDSLNKIEIDLLDDLQGKSALHLQCHFGMDTISLARRGAKVTGVDFSAIAIEKARQLNSETKSNARFIESNVYDLPEKLNEKFDFVFASYGVVGWLHDLNIWANVIQHFLKPGGTFLFVEFHPIVWMFSYDFKKIAYNYASETPIVEELEGTYTDENAAIKEQSVSWNHGLSNVINALIKSGLEIIDFQEYNESPYNCFQNTVKTPDGGFKIKNLEDKIPLVYSIKAIKKL